MARKPYPSDVTDGEWAFVAPYLTLMREDAPQREYSLREVFNGLRYLVRGYQKLGPVFRVRMGTIEYTILAGLEANLFLQGEGNHVLGSKELFGGCRCAYGSSQPRRPRGRAR